MVKVVLTSTVANQYTGGQTEIEVDARSVRQLLRDFESRFPGWETKSNRRWRW